MAGRAQQLLSRCCSLAIAQRGRLAQSASVAPLTSWQSWRGALSEPHSQLLPAGRLFKLLGWRGFATTLQSIQEEVDAINDKFAEARDEIEYALEDAETVYFNESHDTAKAAVSEVLDLYQGCVEKLEGDERGKLQRSMGLKMEQLKAELARLDTLHE